MIIDLHNSYVMVT